MNVLLIDDSAHARKVMRKVLETMDENLLLHEFASGEDALDWCIHSKPEMVVLDLHMAGMDGIHFTKLFRLQDPDHRDVPIVLVTTVLDQQLHKAALEAGIIEVLLKPVIHGHFHSRVRHHIEVRKAQRNPAQPVRPKVKSLKQRIEAAWKIVQSSDP